MFPGQQCATCPAQLWPPRLGIKLLEGAPSTEKWRKGVYFRIPSRKIGVISLIFAQWAQRAQSGHINRANPVVADEGWSLRLQVGARAEDRSDVVGVGASGRRLVCFIAAPACCGGNRSSGAASLLHSTRRTARRGRGAREKNRERSKIISCPYALEVRTVSASRVPKTLHCSGTRAPPRPTFANHEGLP